MKRRPPLLLSVAVVIALACGCQNEIWLSEPDVLAGLDGGHDARVLVPDAGSVDASSIDAADAGPPGRPCEVAPVMVATIATTLPDEAPTFAASGRLTTLRYGVLVPPAASLGPTSDTRLLVLDDEGALLHDRTFRIEDSTGAATSHATLHSLSDDATDDGFLLLAPGAIQMLDADGADGAAVVLATPPSAAWQRAAGWLDADRFAFVSDTPDLRIAVFDRVRATVTTTTISAANAAAVFLDPGGVTLSSAGPTSEAVVYDPDLSGAETLRVPWSTSWDMGTFLGARLLGAGLVAGERTWLVHHPCEFRTFVASFPIAAGVAIEPGPAMQLRCPLVATREGPFVAIASDNPALVLYDFEAHAFSMIATTFTATPLVEHERDGASVAVLFREPTSDGHVSLTLACGRR